MVLVRLRNGFFQEVFIVHIKANLFVVLEKDIAQKMINNEGVVKIEKEVEKGLDIVRQGKRHIMKGYGWRAIEQDDKKIHQQITPADTVDDGYEDHGIKGGEN